ncbi:MAG: hypothetical protein AAB353_06995 [Candidatus Hydrogenedentota bacterium]
MTPMNETIRRRRRWPDVPASPRSIGAWIFWHYRCPWCGGIHAARDDEGETPTAACNRYYRVRPTERES